MKLPAIDPHEGELTYLLRIVATDGLDIALRQRAADRAVKILRKSERNYDGASVWRLAKLMQPGSKWAPGRPPSGYVPGPAAG